METIYSGRGAEFATLNMPLCVCFFFSCDVCEIPATSVVAQNNRDLSSHSLQAGTKVSVGILLPEPLGEGPSSLLQLLVALYSLACGHIPPVPACHYMAIFSSWLLRGHSDCPRGPHLKIHNHIGKDLFSNEVTYTVFRG